MTANVLSPEEIKMTLDNLRENQERLRVDYNERIDKLEAKVDKILDKLEELPNSYITRVEFDSFKEKLKNLEEGRNKLIWIVITAII